LKPLIPTRPLFVGKFPISHVMPCLIAGHANGLQYATVQGRFHLKSHHRKWEAVRLLRCFGTEVNTTWAVTKTIQNLLNPVLDCLS
jgi:hypothetical protein